MKTLISTTLLRFLAGSIALCFSHFAIAGLSDVERDMLVRRSCELAIWGLPAVAAYDIELAIQRDAGAEPGTIAYMTAPMDSRHGFLTANDVTPYVFAGVPLNDEPMVIEVPPLGEKAQLFGSIINAWQRPLVDVGPSG
jgi:hypothetical protein